MKFVSLFAGVEGIGQGLERAGHECVCQVEINEQALSVLRYRYPNVPKIKNVKDANRTNIPEHDILCGGFPCTNLSLAGKREGLAGDASGLWFEFHRIAIECGSRVVIAENVPGIFSSSDGQDFAIVLGGLLGVPVGVPSDGWKSAGIAKGRIYHVAWRILDSQFFGVAQQRRRVFIAACLATSGINPAEILFEREGVRRDYQTCKEARKDFTSPLEGSSGNWSGGGALAQASVPDSMEPNKLGG